MCIFHEGDYVEVMETGRIGVAEQIEEDWVVVDFYDRISLDPETLSFNRHELKSTVLPVLKNSQLRGLVRGELSIKQVLGESNLFCDVVETDGPEYYITAKDLYYGLIQMANLSEDEVYTWLSFLTRMDEVVHFPYEYRKIVDGVSEEDILVWAYSELDDVLFHMSECEMCDGNLPAKMESIKSVLGDWMISKGAKFSKDIRQQIIDQFDDDTIDQESQETQELFKRCLDEACDEKNPKAIQKRGYCYYCGTKIYPNNWVEARDAFLEYYKLTADASAANTLGYIFYYGRCNHGVPEYDKAFYYFSIGHAYGYYESTYKLADMFAHGYGVAKSGETANRLYWSVYNENRTRFENEEYNCKFADAALRIGNCYRDGIGCEKNQRYAYLYYLQANLAIQKRIQEADHYGDATVLAGIQRALRETKPEQKVRQETITNAFPFWNYWILKGYRSCKLEIHEQEDHSLLLYACVLPRCDETKPPLFLVTETEADFCDLFGVLILTTAPNSRYYAANASNEIVFDHIEFAWDLKKTSLYLHQELVGEIKTESYIFSLPKPDVVAPSGEMHRIVSVIFHEHGRPYDYLCDDETVRVGDHVIVYGYDGETEVQVVEVADQHESELVLPLERYKRIVRKVL